MDNATGFLSVSNSSTAGTSASSAFVALDPANLGSTTPLSPGSSVVLYSTETGAYCRVADMPADSNPCTTQSLVCDAPTSAGASTLTWTGSGLSYQGTPLVQLANSTTMVFNSDPACAVPLSDDFSAQPATTGRPVTEQRQ